MQSVLQDLFMHFPVEGNISFAGDKFGHVLSIFRMQSLDLANFKVQSKQEGANC